MKNLLVPVFALFIGTIGMAQNNFAAPVENPFGLGGLSNNTIYHPQWVDLDSDGDLDIISASSAGPFLYFQNTGSPTSPNYAAPTTILGSVAGGGSISMADINNDGLLDAISGSLNGFHIVWLNNGTATNPSFSSSMTDPWNLPQHTPQNTPEWVDLDNDGDYDIVTGTTNGSWGYYENIGTATTPNYGPLQNNPFSIQMDGSKNNAFFVDFDGDNDLDFFKGRQNNGTIHYVENTGTISSPVFPGRVGNPFGYTGNYSNTNPALADVDNDGDIDLILGTLNNTFKFYENTLFDNTCNVTIPDANFKAALVANNIINTNGDSQIQCAEATAYTGQIVVPGSNIADLTGIEAFTQIVGLQAFNNNLTTLDLSQNTLITQLLVENNNITSSVDLSMLTSLTDFKMHSNNVLELNVANGNNANFTRFETQGNGNLDCIQIDAGFTPPGFWLTDPTTGFSSDCSNQAPIAVCQNIDVFLNAAGNAMISGADIDNGSTDDDIIISMALDTNTFTCADIGANTVTLTVTDNDGVSSSCSAIVTVIDNVLPEVIVPADITVDNDPGQCSAFVSISLSGSDNCSASISDDAPAGSVFPVGITTVNVTVTDSSGNTAIDSFNVTVNDVESPVLGALPNITQDNDPGQCSAFVSISLSGSDNCSASISDDAPAGSIFPVGVTTVNVTITDTAGNTDTGSFTVTINDTEAPTLNLPADVVQDADSGQCSAIIPLSFSGSDNCGGGNISSDIPPQNIFPVGTTTVNVIVTDDSGNTATGTFTVTVNDTELPTITCPVSETVMVPQGTQYTLPDYLVTGDTVAMDNCTFTTTQTPVPGTMLAPGTFTIEFEATDASGNVSNCDFELIVDEVLGTNDFSSATFKLFPNPATSQITIKGSFDIATIEVYNLLGQKVLNSTAEILNIQEIANGMYLVNITDVAGNKATKKFIKK